MFCFNFTIINKHHHELAVIFLAEYFCYLVHELRLRSYISAF